VPCCRSFAAPSFPGFSQPAFAQAVSFANFSSSPGLTLAGTAAIAKTDDGVNLHIALADNSTIRPADQISAPLSLPTLFNYATGVYAGFTAGTGGGFEDHDILNWRYDNTYNPTPQGTQQALPSLTSAPLTLPPPRS
jgi:hypothetical protein